MVVLTVVFVSVVMDVFVLAVSEAPSVLLELSLQATKVPAITNTLKNFFMLCCGLFKY